MTEAPEQRFLPLEDVAESSLNTSRNQVYAQASRALETLAFFSVEVHRSAFTRAGPRVPSPGNARENGPMIAVNDRLGFRPIARRGNWERELSDGRRLFGWGGRVVGGDDDAGGGGDGVGEVERRKRSVVGEEAATGSQHQWMNQQFELVDQIVRQE